MHYLCWFPGGIVTLGCPVNFCKYTSGKHYQKCLSYIITCICWWSLLHIKTNITHVGCSCYLIFSNNAQLSVKVWHSPASRCQYRWGVSTSSPLTSVALLTFTVVPDVSESLHKYKPYSNICRKYLIDVSCHLMKYFNFNVVFSAHSNHWTYTVVSDSGQGSVFLLLHLISQSAYIYKTGTHAVTIFDWHCCERHS